MINSISGKNYINLYGNLKSASKPSFKGLTTDSFEHSKSSQSELLEYAKNKVIDVLKKTGKEYMVIINPDGSIFENEGEINNCSIDINVIKPGATGVHGHPVNFPLSAPDLASFLSSDISCEIAYLKDGRYSKISKTEHSKPASEDYNTLYKNFETQLCLSALDKLGIDYHYNEKDIKQMCSDVFPDLETKSFEEITEYMSRIGYPINGTPDDMAEQLKKGILSFKILYDTEKKYDKTYNTIKSNYDKIKCYLSTQEGIVLRNELVKKVAKDYDLIYETNIF